MRPRSKPLGEMNVVGARITSLRAAQGLKQKELLARLQTNGMELTGSCLSKIEGQTRMVTDKELLCVAGALGVGVQELF